MTSRNAYPSTSWMLNRRAIPSGVAHSGPATVVLVDRDVVDGERKTELAGERGGRRPRKSVQHPFRRERAPGQDRDDVALGVRHVDLAREGAVHDDELLRVGQIRRITVDHDPELAADPAPETLQAELALAERDDAAARIDLHVDWDRERREHGLGVVLKPFRAQRRAAPG